MTTVLRPHAEQQFAAELAALRRLDDRPRPTNWQMSPWAVVTYVLGGALADGTVITPKYVGQRRLVEIAVATLITDRALLLLGVPGTAKTWLSEHLAAAISGNSTLLVQGTAGTTEESLRYGWNYARLLAEGPSPAALVESPVLRATNRAALQPEIDAVFATMPASAVVERLDAAGIGNATVNEMRDVWAHPQLAARDRWREMPSPVGPLPSWPIPPRG